jgi:hypothetical protein
MSMLTASASVWGVDYGALKTLGLVLFFAVFMIILLRLLFSRSARYERAARMPLENDGEGHHERRVE